MLFLENIIFIFLKIIFLFDNQAKITLKILLSAPGKRHRRFLIFTFSSALFFL